MTESVCYSASLIRDDLKARADPIWGLKHFYNWEPEIKQEEIAPLVLRPGSRTAVKSFNKGGKTALAGKLMVEWYRRYPVGGKVIATSGSYRQVRRMLWPEVRRPARMVGPLYGWDIKPKDTLIEDPMNEDHFMLGFSTDDVDLFEGFSAIHLMAVMDESKAIPAEIWEGVYALQPEVILAISTPGQPEGEFYRRFHDRKTFADWNTVTILPEDVLKRPSSPLRAEKIRRWVEEMAQVYGPQDPIYQRRVEAKFVRITENPYLSWWDPDQERYHQDHIREAFERVLPAGRPRVLGVDVGKYGSFNVLVDRSGPLINSITVHQDGEMALADEIHDLYKRNRYQWIGIDAYGEAVVERLYRLRVPKARVESIVYSGPNKRKMYGFLKGDFEDPTRLAFNPKISEKIREWAIQQLEELQVSETKTGQISIHKPDNEGGDHYDDIPDAMAATSWRLGVKAVGGKPPMLGRPVRMVGGRA